MAKRQSLERFLESDQVQSSNPVGDVISAIFGANKNDIEANPENIIIVSDSYKINEQAAKQRANDSSSKTKSESQESVRKQYAQEQAQEQIIGK